MEGDNILIRTKKKMEIRKSVKNISNQTKLRPLDINILRGLFEKRRREIKEKEEVMNTLKGIFGKKHKSRTIDSPMLS